MRAAIWRGAAAVVMVGGLATAALSGADGGSARQPARQPADRVTEVRQAAQPALAPAKDESCGPQHYSPRQSYRPAGALPQPGHMPAGSTMAAIVHRGRLIAGVDQNSYLFGYRNPLTGELDGYEIDLLKQISTALFGRPDRIEYRTITSAQRIPVLTKEHDPVDIVIDSMTMNCDRWQDVAFSSDYMDAGQRVLVPRNSTADSIRDLGGKRICAAKKTTSIETLASLKDPAVVPVGVNDWTDCLMLLQLGKVDGVSTDDTILIGLAAQDPNTKLIGPRFTDEPHGIAMQPDQIDFVRFVNGVLEQLRQNDWLARSASNWLQGDTTFGPPPAEYRD